MNSTGLIGSREPTSLRSYQERFQRNAAIIGAYIGTLEIHCPCPFCAAADWIVYRLSDFRPCMRRGAICGECGRGARAAFANRIGSASVDDFALLQTSGPDAPAWLEPKPRRESASAITAESDKDCRHD